MNHSNDEDFYFAETTLNQTNGLWKSKVNKKCLFYFETKGCVLHNLFSVEFQDPYHVTTIIGEEHF